MYIYIKYEIISHSILSVRIKTRSRFSIILKRRNGYRVINSSLRSELHVSISGECNIVPSVEEDCDHGVLNVNYDSRKVGLYQISVLIYGQHIKNSPFNMTVAPGDICGEHCKLIGMGMGNTETTVIAVSCQETSFCIETADIQGNIRFSKVIENIFLL
jgi:hypothetical protein